MFHNVYHSDSTWIQFTRMMSQGITWLSEPTEVQQDLLLQMISHSTMGLFKQTLELSSAYSDSKTSLK